MACFRDAHHDVALHRRGAQHAACRAPRGGGHGGPYPPSRHRARDRRGQRWAPVRADRRRRLLRLPQRIGCPGGRRRHPRPARVRGLGIDPERPRADRPGYRRARGVRGALLRPHPVSVRPHPVTRGRRRDPPVGHDRDRGGGRVAGRAPAARPGRAEAARAGRHRARVGRGTRRCPRRSGARRHDPPAAGRRLRGGAARPARLPGADAADRDRGRGVERDRGRGSRLSAPAGRDPDGPGHAPDGRPDRDCRHP